MPPDGAAVSKFRHQRRERAQVVAQPGRRNSCILPSFQPIRLARNKNIPCQRGVANMPDPLCVLRRMNLRIRISRPRRRLARQLFRLLHGLTGGPRAHLHQQESPRLRQQLHVAHIDALLAHKAHQHPIEALQPDGTMFQREHHGVRRQKSIRECKHHQHAMGRAGR